MFALMHKKTLKFARFDTSFITQDSTVYVMVSFQLDQSYPIALFELRESIDNLVGPFQLRAPTVGTFLNPERTVSFLAAVYSDEVQVVEFGSESHITRADNPTPYNWVSWSISPEEG